MEINAKIASLEDEVKLLKGEVKLILSEIRTAILGQDNPFAEPGQALRADHGALESRPPIRVVHVPSDDEEAEQVDSPTENAPQSVWNEDTEAGEPQPAMAEEPPAPPPEPEPAPAPLKPIATQQAPVQPPAPPVAASTVEPAPDPLPAAPPAPTPIATATARAPAPPPVAAPALPAGAPHWSLITVAGLAIWAEESIKQIGSKRLRILLDLCEYSGNINGPIKEALLKVTSLGVQAKETTTPPSANDCLVVLCQLDALMKGEQPAGRSFSSLADKWQQPA
jgi:hypothetical protein